MGSTAALARIEDTGDFWLAVLAGYEIVILGF
jgi:hypothetical protein